MLARPQQLLFHGRGDETALSGRGSGRARSKGCARDPVTVSCGRVERRARGARASDLGEALALDLRAELLLTALGYQDVERILCHDGN